MRTLLILAGLIVAAPTAAQTSTTVRGHVRSDGVYIPQHQRTNPNSTTLDNWSTRGNVNPYTGKVGTVDPYRTPSTTSSYPTYRPYKPKY